MPTTIRSTLTVVAPGDRITLVELVALVDSLPAGLVDAARALSLEPRPDDPDSREALDPDPGVAERDECRRLLAAADVELEADTGRGNLEEINELKVTWSA